MVLNGTMSLRRPCRKTNNFTQKRGGQSVEDESDSEEEEEEDIQNEHNLDEDAIETTKMHFLQGSR